MIKKLTLSVVLLTIFILSQNTANAGYFSDNSHIDDNMGFLKNTMNKNTSTEDVQEPVIAPAPKAKIAKIASKINPVATLTVQASAYTSTPDQTDSSPFITANGEHVYWGGVAANIIDASGRNIPFGTRIMIPKLFGDQIFTVNDRMNRRYKNNVDLWFHNITDAREFGRRTIEIVIIAKN
ncbi:MAG: hypothetical protein UT29_C0001G0061 [Candidatus Yanofskybacteria bacterium GW2011_GWA1_39_13]|uniref:3D domain-containing protein n=1 Tax=Yanofskybacteria sp. (strain GW2011_GWA1_39_13) TaxID=1619019 RepID=A0A0G0MQ55_YANXG|nr:MAG: hypothetical protein UT29_C0001G0061 [Candidatus Yanofskybacteria bacterium GW2011_GWA1_39_13]